MGSSGEQKGLFKTSSLSAFVPITSSCSDLQVSILRQNSLGRRDKKKVRRDFFGVEINSMKKNHCVTFVDQVLNRPLTEIQLIHEDSTGKLASKTKKNVSCGCTIF